MDEEQLDADEGRPGSRCHEDGDVGGGAEHNRRLVGMRWKEALLALLAGKVEALGQSSQS